MNLERIKKQLKEHEGVRSKVYKCSMGIETIGVGRNLRDVGLSDKEIDYLLHNDIVRVINELQDSFVWFYDLTDKRKEALVNMCFNLGINRLKGFKNMLGYMRVGNYDKAADEALDSLWSKQVGKRALIISDMIRS